MYCIQKYDKPNICIKWLKIIKLEGNKIYVPLENYEKQNKQQIAIITKNISKMKNIEEQILEETGAIITVMNNKKRSLAKAKIVINIDFPTELLKQYTLYEESIIIDLTQNIKILKKRFNGTIITNYEISLKNKQIYKKEDELFFMRDLYEAEIYKNQPYKYVRDKIKREGIQIKNLYTKNQRL